VVGEVGCGGQSANDEDRKGQVKMSIHGYNSKTFVALAVLPPVDLQSIYEERASVCIPNLRCRVRAELAR
jgi:hypothetical protein